MPIPSFGKNGIVDLKVGVMTDASGRPEQIDLEKGEMVTKTLVIMGDRQVTAPPGRPRGAMLRAYDKQTGENVGAVWMPAGQTGSPMAYMIDGRQFIVASGGAGSQAEYIAFALPQADLTSSGARPQP